MKIEIYGKTSCPYCDNAKQVCDIRDLDYTYLQLGSDYQLEELQQKTPGFSTFPAVFVDDEFIGGFDQLVKVVK